MHSNEPKVCLKNGVQIKSSVVVLTYEDPSSMRFYSNLQLFGLFSLGVGVPSIISSFPLHQRRANDRKA